MNCLFSSLCALQSPSVFSATIGRLSYITTHSASLIFTFDISVYRHAYICRQTHCCWAVRMCSCRSYCTMWAYLSKVAGQVPVDDALTGNGTSLPDGDAALDEDASETEEQSERRKEAEESFKVQSLCISKAWQANLHSSISGCTAPCTVRDLQLLGLPELAATLHLAACVVHGLKMRLQPAVLLYSTVLHCTHGFAVKLAVSLFCCSGVMYQLANRQLWCCRHAGSDGNNGQGEG